MYTEKEKAQGKRISAHDRKIRELRKAGKLKPLGQTTRSIVVKKVKILKQKPNKVFLTDSGSLLPNRWASWSYPFDRIIDKDL